MAGTVQSVERTLCILETLSDYPDGIGVGELSELIGLHKSTVHRLLATLMQKDYVKKDENNQYQLTFKLFELGSKQVENLELSDVAKPYLQQLMEKTNEVVHLVIPENTEIIYIDKVEPDTTIRMHSRIGTRRPLYCTGVGKAILSQLSMEEVREVWDQSDIEKLTPYTITEFEQMKQRLEQIKKRGFAIDEQENEIGVRCIAAPILDYTKNVCGAISVSAPTIRMTDERIKQFSTILIEYCEQISKELGYRE